MKKCQSDQTVVVATPPPPPPPPLPSLTPTFWKTNPTFVASILCSTITNLERKGLRSNLLKNQEIFKLFELLDKGEIAKESIEIILELNISLHQVPHILFCSLLLHSSGEYITQCPGLSGDVH